MRNFSRPYRPAGICHVCMHVCAVFMYVCMYEGYENLKIIWIESLPITVVFSGTYRWNINRLLYV